MAPWQSAEYLLRVLPQVVRFAIPCRHEKPQHIVGYLAHRHFRRSRIWCLGHPLYQRAIVDRERPRLRFQPQEPVARVRIDIGVKWGRRLKHQLFVKHRLAIFVGSMD